MHVRLQRVYDVPLLWGCLLINFCLNIALKIQEHSHGTGKSMLEYDESNVYTEVKIIKREEKKFTDVSFC